MRYRNALWSVKRIAVAYIVRLACEIAEELTYPPETINVRPSSCILLVVNIDSARSNMLI